MARLFYVSLSSLCHHSYLVSPEAMLAELAWKSLYTTLPPDHVIPQENLPFNRFYTFRLMTSYQK